MRSLYLTFIFSFSSSILFAQSIVGTWQLVKQTSCMDQQMDNDEETEALLDEMKSMSSPSQKTITFKENNSGMENIRLIGKRKAASASNFLYKFNGTTLYILDKKSQTLISAHTVETLTSDSLIFSNTSRACETRVLVRIK